MNDFSILLKNNLCNLEVGTAASNDVEDIITLSFTISLFTISFVMGIAVLRLIANIQSIDIALLKTFKSVFSWEKIIYKT